MKTKTFIDSAVVVERGTDDWYVLLTVITPDGRRYCFDGGYSSSKQDCDYLAKCLRGE